MNQKVSGAGTRRRPLSIFQNVDWGPANNCFALSCPAVVLLGVDGVGAKFGNAWFPSGFLKGRQRCWSDTVVRRGRRSRSLRGEVCLLRTNVRFLREERWASTRSWWPWWFAKGHR